MNYRCLRTIRVTTPTHTSAPPITQTQVHELIPATYIVLRGSRNVYFIRLAIIMSVSGQELRNSTCFNQSWVLEGVG